MWEKLLFKRKPAVADVVVLSLSTIIYTGRR
ncbi:Protein of unknown function [Pyronema omphalodes CBS 100304]|uniref:Uncharacterized protein n=1 Tax=Pyronema omphalodes (strain CBS 100304) TaxID=1076935 RepID=U4LKC2_PYROM|nr:Protein of unknown function [Pyronema omphalodes CBS 100304]